MDLRAYGAIVSMVPTLFQWVRFFMVDEYTKKYSLYAKNGRFIDFEKLSRFKMCPFLEKTCPIKLVKSVGFGHKDCINN